MVSLAIKLLSFSPALALNRPIKGDDPMTDFTTRSTAEAKTYELFAPFTQGETFDPSKAIVGKVFQAMYHSSLPADRVTQIGVALSGIGVDLQEALTKLVRDKVLRSRVISGVRHYEVNY
jgi:hypothetical protein